MFTGLIETTGTLLHIEHPSGEKPAGARRIAVSAPGIHLRTGDSIAVSGVCLTAIEIDSAAGRFHADLSEETIARTTLASLGEGSTVNLELPTPAGTPLGGHVVQGHVDGMGKLLSLAPVDAQADPERMDWWLRVEVPAELSRYVVDKGSIAIEGISLTVARWKPEEGNVVEVAIIPHTYAKTNLPTLRPGQVLNLEADVLLKFIEQRRREGEFNLTPEFLIAQGY